MFDQKVHYGRLTESQMMMGLRLAGVGLTLVDYTADTVTPDDRAAEVFGLTPHEPVSRAAFHARIHPADLPAVLDHVDRLLDPSCDDVIEVKHRTVDANGATRWVHARKQLYRGEGAKAGTAQTGIAAILDITPQMQAEEASELLIRELQHRTANVVSIITSIARMVVRSGPSETFLERFEPRIENLSQNLKVRDAKVEADLGATIRSALKPFRSEIPGQVACEGPEVALRPDQSQTFAMLIHELATNATKYGALSRVSGRVAVTWGVDRGVLTLTWQERGGPAVSPPGKRGFGTQVLERFAALTLGAEASQHYEPAGYRYALRMPLDAGDGAGPGT